MKQPESSLRIKSIKVTGLFGLYDHLVTLTEERVTVIHGPNGVGKTVFLKLVDAFLGGRYLEISKIAFESFEIIFTDDSFVEIRRKGDSDQELKMLFRFGSSDADSTRTLLEIFNGKLTRRPDEFQRWLNPNEPLKRITVHLIEIQRLIKLSNNWDTEFMEWGPSGIPKGRSKVINTVQEYSNDLQSKLKSALATYAERSQKLDQTFPQRLLQQDNTALTIEQLKQKMQQIEDTRKRLQTIGILDKEDSSQEVHPLQMQQLDALKPEQIPVMAVYANDTQEKLAVLEELSGRAEILLNVLNKKFTNKKVTLSRESGLAIFSKNGDAIPVTALSSGEQHELVLLYDLLFKVKPDTLVLIDEPELSLHISWQKDFMDDLLAIIKLAKFDVIMATHSPYIVGDHSNLLVMLSPETEH
jgi:predicted ATP-binding protein involved in virulence